MKYLLKIIILFSISILTADCGNINKIENSGFESRLHESSYHTDFFKILGPTKLEKHIKDFERIDWETEYWKENNQETFNSPDLEVLDKNSNRYLSVSVCPNTHDSYQFYFGLGNHIETIIEDSIVINRTIKLYGSLTNNPKDVEFIFHLFFERKYEDLNIELNRMDFWEEIEDKYLNIENE